MTVGVAGMRVKGRSRVAELMSASAVSSRWLEALASKLTP